MPKRAYSRDDLTPGVELMADGAWFTVYAPNAMHVDICLFNIRGRETARHSLPAADNGHFSGFIKGVNAGDRYGLRVDGPFAPESGHRFDPAKLLVDPYATRIDRPFAYHPDLAVFGTDTAPLVPKAIIEPPLPPGRQEGIAIKPGAFIYELSVRAFTRLMTKIPKKERGTLKALAHPVVIEHLKALHVDAVELMPVNASIDERHLPPLGLSNAWGYNPVTMLALDPRLAPGGMADLRFAVDALHDAGIAVILDVVYNHTGESDIHGPTLSLRGLGNAEYYRHHANDPGELVNDTGCGNTLACDRACVQELVLASMRNFVSQAGIDGFRFDLAPVLARVDHGFSPDAGMLHLIRNDPVLGDKALIAEPWDIGPGGYQLGNFPAPWLEWNDRARDTIRRFWRGDEGMLGAFATALSGSSDVFSGEGTRSVTFIAAHDGFTLADLVSHTHKHNEANGEDNRDGHNENHSWNNGVEGRSDDPSVIAARLSDLKALIATLFLCRGTIQMTAGDEMGRSQQGNNNAYAQDNEITWVDWKNRDDTLLAHTRNWAAIRSGEPLLQGSDFLVAPDGSDNPLQAGWYNAIGHPMTPGDWENPHADHLVLLRGAPGARLMAVFNRSHEEKKFEPPEGTGTFMPLSPDCPEPGTIPARSVHLWREVD